MPKHKITRGKIDRSRGGSRLNRGTNPSNHTNDQVQDASKEESSDDDGKTPEYIAFENEYERVLQIVIANLKQARDSTVVQPLVDFFNQWMDAEDTKEGTARSSRKKAWKYRMNMGGKGGKEATRAIRDAGMKLLDSWVEGGEGGEDVEGGDGEENREGEGEEEDAHKEDESADHGKGKGKGKEKVA